MNQLAVVLALLLAVSGCGHASRTTPTGGLDRLLDPGLGGKRAVVKSATGPMDLKLAAEATAIPSDTLVGFLRQHGFQAGYSRVWRSSSEVVTALGYHFFADRDADAMVELARDLLPTSRFYQPLTDPLVPQSAGYQLVSRVNGSTKFCLGEFFSVHRDAFVVTHCADYPLPTTAATELAQRQLVRAVTESAS